MLAMALSAGVYASSISKCTVKAGKVPGMDSIQISGLLNATAQDIETAADPNVIVTLSSKYMNEREFRFPINAVSYKNGRYNYSRMANASKQSFKYSPTNGKMSFAVSKDDFTGLSCTINMVVKIGDFEADFKLDEALVNKKRLCPMVLMQGVANSFIVDKTKLKFGKATGTDSLTVSGYFTMLGNYDLIQPLAITLGNQTFTVPAGSFNPKSSLVSCKKAPINQGGFLSAKLDFAKCTFSLTLTNIAIEQYDSVPFGVNVFGSASLGGAGVAGAEVDLGPKMFYNYWELTQYDQSGAWWDYDSKYYPIYRDISNQGFNAFRVFDDEGDAYSYWDIEKQGDKTIMQRFMIESDWDEEFVIGDSDMNLLYYPSVLRAGQTHNAEVPFTGYVDMGGWYPQIDLSGTMKTTVQLSNKFKTINYRGTAYQALQVKEIQDTLANIYDPYSNQIIGKFRLSLTTTSYYVPGLGAVNFTRKFSIKGAGIKAGDSEKAVLVDTNMD
jgi:hypothetical protein